MVSHFPKPSWLNSPTASIHIQARPEPMHEISALFLICTHMLIHFTQDKHLQKPSPCLQDVPPSFPNRLQALSYTRQLKEVQALQQADFSKFLLKMFSFSLNSFIEV